MIKQGDVLETKNGGGKRKVLAVCGEVYALSCMDEFKAYSNWYTLQELEVSYTLPKEKWIPKFEENYWFIGDNKIWSTNWYDDEDDNARVNHLGIYKTEGEAEQMLLKLKEVAKV